MLLPDKKAFSWLNVLILVFTLNGLALIFSRILLKNQFSASSLFGFLGLALAVALVSCLGFLGLRAYSLAYLICDAAAIAYLMISAALKSSEGWSDLTSLAGYMVIAAVSIPLCLLIELIVRIVKRNKKQ